MLTETNHREIRTLGDLRRAGWTPRSVKRELRENLTRALAAG
jgi:hypothetical protein